jgi:Mg/Co/Ni transporter MgtE
MGVKESRQVRKLLGYKEKTAGGIMTPEVTTVTEDMTVAQVIEHLRTAAAENEHIYYVYVVGSKRVLAGVVSLRDLIVSDPDKTIAEIVVRDVFTVGPDDDQEQVAEMMSKYDLLALPVVDESGRLIGMVTVDDALDVMEQEAQEDLALVTGRTRGQELAGAWRWVSRDGWLVVWAVLLLGSAAASRASGAVGAALFSTVLVSPMLLRIAEDVASHAMARVIDPENEEERPPYWRRLAGDGIIGFVLGVAVGLIWFGVLILRTPAGSPGATSTALATALAFGLSVLGVTVAGTIAGSIAQHLSDRGKRVSQVALAVVLMLLGEAVFVGLQMAISALLAMAGIR